MPINQEIVTEVSCDNPNCPGNTLDPSTLDGWLVINYEIRDASSSQSAQNVFCSTDCLSAFSAAPDSGIVSRPSEGA
jgi:hypothetical protein